MKQALIVSITILMLITLFANSQTRLSRREYIDLYKDIAIREMYQFGIPASIKMAQGCLESDNGNSILARKSNNHFGIKCKNSWTGARVFHDDDEAGECFRKYQYVEESYIDHSLFLTQNSRYAFLFKLDRTDYKGLAQGLKNAGYATDPKYPEKLIKLIEEEKLYLLDKVKPEDLPKRDETVADNQPFSAGAAKEKVKGALSNFTINPYDSRYIREVNGLKAIETEGGDTFESIARELDMKVWELHHYNDLSRNAPEPEPGTILYIERKRYVAPKGMDFHRVGSGETMYGISQKYGIRLSSLYRKNRMKKGTEPYPGDQLYLRTRKPKK
jgi:LysM repeat protein